MTRDPIFAVRPPSLNRTEGRQTKPAVFGYLNCEVGWLSASADTRSQRRKILTFADEIIAVNGFKVSEAMAANGTEISLGAQNVFLAPLA